MNKCDETRSKKFVTGRFKIHKANHRNKWLFHILQKSFRSVFRPRVCIKSRAFFNKNKIILNIKEAELNL